MIQRHFDIILLISMGAEAAGADDYASSTSWEDKEAVAASEWLAGLVSLIL